MAHQKSRIIATTGTKGKTTVTRILAHALNAVLKEPVLSTDTDRVFLGDKVHATTAESIEMAGLLPTVCPGRFLTAIRDHKQPVAVLEASLGCGRGSGLGYHRHEVGIFTNVYDDHIGNRPDLQSREDIARVKSFIFTHIDRGGWAVYNADDELVVSRLTSIDPSKDIHTIACTLAKERPKADFVVTVEGKDIVIYEGDTQRHTIPVARFGWLLGGAYEPMLRNALSIISALFGFFYGDDAAFQKALAALETYQPDTTGGRMVRGASPDGYEVILDFAHEAQSLSELGRFAHSLAKQGKVIGWKRNVVIGQRR